MVNLVKLVAPENPVNYKSVALPFNLRLGPKRWGDLRGLACAFMVAKTRMARDGMASFILREQ